MHRKLIAYVLAFLLLGLQQELLVHPLTHLGDLRQRHEVALQLPATDAPCVECSLLAGAANAVNHVAAPLPSAAIAGERFAFGAPSQFAAAPFYYLSRAPPTLL